MSTAAVYGLMTFELHYNLISSCTRNFSLGCNSVIFTRLGGTIAPLHPSWLQLLHCTPPGYNCSIAPLLATIAPLHPSWLQLLHCTPPGYNCSIASLLATGLRTRWCLAPPKVARKWPESGPKAALLLIIPSRLIRQSQTIHINGY